MALKARVAVALQKGHGTIASSRTQEDGEGHGEQPSLCLHVVCCSAVSARDSQRPRPPRIWGQEELNPATRVVGWVVIPEIDTVPEICSHLNWPVVMRQIKITQKLEQD